MSAFLGPIHTWLYGKVLFQNGLVEYIESYAKENSWMTEAIDTSKLGELEQGNLEDICDSDNIHGWLQERVSLVESKLAYLVTALTKEAPGRITEIADISYKYGKENGLQVEVTIPETYQFLETKLLSGMPCDHVNEIVEQDDNHLIWQQVTDIHRRYWDDVDGSLEMYYVIKDRLIEGLVSNTGHMVITHDNYIYELK